ncbi:MAG: hypothetical protein ACTH0V_00460 [Microbacteriaceae bacterium]
MNLRNRHDRILPFAYRVLPAGYDRSRVDGREHFEVHVEWRGVDPASGLDRWAVTNRGRCLATDGTWHCELRPSRRDDRWLEQHRYSRDEALRRALDVVDRLRINGRTLAEWDDEIDEHDGR